MPNENQDNKKSRLLKWGLLFGMWGLLLCVFWMDYLVHYRMNFFIFYLVPVLAMTYREGIRQGLAMSVAGAVLWLIADMSSGHRYEYFFLPYWNALTRLALFVGSAYLLYFWKIANTSARMDSLTGLANRKSFREALDAEIRKSNRYLHPLSIAFIDLDNLKSVNDRLGHKAGDGMIKRLSSAIRDTARDTDVAARFGGDEFAILFPETGEAGAKMAIERIQARLHDSPRLHPGVFLTISAGITTFMNGVASIDAAIESADQLMYEAKKSGKNCIRTSSS